MNNNLRPFLAFLAIVVLIGAAFWGVLTYASRYNNRLASPEPIAQVEEQPTKDEATEEPQKETPAPEKPQENPKPQPTTDAPQPVAPPPAPSAPVPAPVVTAGAVPATGLGSNLVLTSIFIMIATFLIILLRSQQLHIRPNR